jgi:integrase/recombinase XerD
LPFWAERKAFVLDQLFRRAAVRARIRANPLGPILERYIDHLVARGHRASPLHQYVFAVEHFGRWLRGRPIDHAMVGQFIKRHLPRCRCRKPAVRNIDCVRAALNRLLEMLGVVQPAPAGTKLASRRLLQAYESHLVNVQGLASPTVRYRLRYARGLLRRFQVCRARQLRGWTVAQIVDYVSDTGRRCKPSSGQVTASSIRSFLRFLLLRGLIHRDLAAAVPSFANWRLSSLPATVAQTELEQMISAVDAATPVGKRDRAILLCMTELGLRGADVANLRQDGPDLSAGVLQLHRPKQRDQIQLPMTPRLVNAIRGYLHHARPACTSSALFVIHRAPVGSALKAIGVRDVVQRCAARAGLGQRIRGTHVIRRSVATGLINSGASLKQIADLLGHRSIDTTSIYAKVDLRSLAQVALPWPSRQEVIP